MAKSDNTRRAYRAAVRAWCAWCARPGRWQGFVLRVHTGAFALWREGRSCGGSSKGSGRGGLLRSSS